MQGHRIRVATAAVRGEQAFLRMGRKRHRSTAAMLKVRSATPGPSLASTPEKSPAKGGGDERPHSADGSGVAVDPRVARMAGAGGGGSHTDPSGSAGSPTIRPSPLGPRSSPLKKSRSEARILTATPKYRRGGKSPGGLTRTPSRRTNTNRGDADLRKKVARGRMRRASHAVGATIRLARSHFSRKRPGLPPPTNLRWQSLPNGTVRLGWHATNPDVHIADTPSLSSRTMRFLVQVRTCSSRTSVPSDTGPWEFDSGLVLELTVDELRVAGLRLPTVTSNNGYCFRVARVEHGKPETWSHPQVFWNDVAARGGLSRAQSMSNHPTSVADTLLQTPRFMAQATSSPASPLRRLESFHSSGLKRVDSAASVGSTSSVGVYNVDDDETGSTKSAATPTMLVRAGSVRRNLTPVAAEVARTRVEELTDSPVARGAGSGVGAGAGTQPPKSSSLRSLTATPLSAKGSTAWDAASVHSMFAEFDPSDRAVPAAVIDHGSADLKLGLSTNAAPAIYRSIGDGSHSSSFRVDRNAGYGAMFSVQLEYPVQHGRIVNYPEAKQLWVDALAHDFQTDLEDRAVVMTAPLLDEHDKMGMLNHEIVMSEMLEDMFDSEWISALRLNHSAPLALYAQGLTSGCVVGVGADVTQVVPVYCGNIVRHGVVDVPVSGRHITNRLARIVGSMSDRSFIDPESLERMRGFKESVAYVAAKHALGNPVPPVKFTLPDGSSVMLTDEGAQSAELLFTPDLSSEHAERDPSLGSTGVHIATVESFSSVDPDLHASLKSNVLLSGGTTCIPGLPERLQAELDASLGHAACEVHMFAQDYRNTAEWMGACVVASMWAEASPVAEFVTKHEWFEWGPSICHRKFSSQ